MFWPKCPYIHFISFLNELLYNSNSAILLIRYCLIVNCVQVIEFAQAVTFSTHFYPNIMKAIRV